MDTTKSRNTGIPDYPENTPMNPPGKDRKRAVIIILAVVLAALLVSVIMSMVGPTEDPYLPESRNATGANAPAIPVPPARNPAPQ